MEEVVLAAKGLTEVTTVIHKLSERVHRNRKTILVLTEGRRCLCTDAPVAAFKFEKRRVCYGNYVELMAEKHLTATRGRQKSH